jgi:hypothetical protein
MDRKCAIITSGVMTVMCQGMTSPKGGLCVMIQDAESFEEASLFPEGGPAKPPTGGAVLAALEELGIVGMWADRTDIEDSGEFARDLRERSETRNPG